MIRHGVRSFHVQSNLLCLSMCFLLSLAFNVMEFGVKHSTKRSRPGGISQKKPISNTKRAQIKVSKASKFSDVPQLCHPPAIIYIYYSNLNQPKLMKYGPMVPNWDMSDVLNVRTVTQHHSTRLQLNRKHISVNENWERKYSRETKWVW